MAWGVGAEVGSSTGSFSDKHDAPIGEEFLSAMISCSDPSAIARCKLFALRRVAEGSGLTPADLIAIHLFLADSGFHGAVSECWKTLAAHQASQKDAERAAALQGAHTQVAHAIRAVPAKKAICYRACRIMTESGTLREIIKGHRHGRDQYQLGSLVMWRHAASATTDCNLAQEIALRGSPQGGCGIIFKVRRSLSARPVAEFSEYPEQGEVVFPAGAIFKVVGLYPCSESTFSRGGGSDGPWSVDVGYVAKQVENISGEEACRARSIVIVLDEETAGAMAAAERVA
jgi:hypothetical protein